MGIEKIAQDLKDQFGLFEEIANVSERIEKTREFIRGGTLTDTLEAIGDIHFSSAIEHLRQASGSTLPRDRLIQASSDLQVAFLAFDQAAEAGPLPWLRIRVDWKSVSRSHDRAAGCASTIALLQWVIGESEHNRRRWVDRTARHLAEYLRKGRSLWLRNDPNTLTWRPFQFKASVLLHEYFKFEENVLPPHMVRPRPLSGMTVGEAEKAGIRVFGATSYRDEYWFPRYDPG